MPTGKKRTKNASGMRLRLLRMRYWKRQEKRRPRSYQRHANRRIFSVRKVIMKEENRGMMTASERHMRSREDFLTRSWQSSGQTLQ